MTVLKTTVLVLDCAEPEPLARFYAELLGATVGPFAENGELLLVTGSGGGLIGIRRDPHHNPQSWPLPQGSQEAHLRILVPVDSLDEAEREAVALGARPVAAEEDGTRPDNRTTLRRYTDPAGHPFVLAAVREDLAPYGAGPGAAAGPGTDQPQDGQP